MNARTHFLISRPRRLIVAHDGPRAGRPAYDLCLPRASYPLYGPSCSNSAITNTKTHHYLTGPFGQRGRDVTGSDNLWQLEFCNFVTFKKYLAMWHTAFVNPTPERHKRLPLPRESNRPAAEPPHRSSEVDFKFASQVRHSRTVEILLRPHAGPRGICRNFSEVLAEDL